MAAVVSTGERVHFVEWFRVWPPSVGLPKRNVIHLPQRTTQQIVLGDEIFGAFVNAANNVRRSPVSCISSCLVHHILISFLRGVAFGGTA